MQNSFWKLTLVAIAMTVPAITLAQGNPAAPFAGGKTVTLAEAVKLAPQQDKSLAPLAKAADAAEAKLKKLPKDAVVKKAYVEAAFNFGKGAEYSSVLGAKVKYRAALAMYRKALAVDPKHEPSLKEKKQIDDIYKDMPGGIPK